MQPLALFVAVLAGTTGVMADVHKYAYCTSSIQPIGNPNTCPANTLSKRGEPSDMSLNLARSRILGRSYGDNEAATRKACAAYKARNTGTKQWDTCPDCVMGWRHSTDPTYCVNTCNSAASHIGGDEWNYYCKQAGADNSEAF